MVNIKEKFIPKNTNARPGYAMVPQFITIHNTSNSKVGANAASHASYLNNSGKDTYVSYHFVVDDKEAYQLLPCNESGWHAGDGANGTGNRKSIGIEICENADGNLLKATDNAVELTAYLMKQYNIPLSKVVQHNNWSGKNCPMRIRAGEPYNWTTFLNKVQTAYNGMTTSVKHLSESACKLHIGPASSGDIRTIVNLADELGIKTETANGYVITGAASKGDQITILTECKKLGLGCKIYEEPKVEVVTPTPTPTPAPVVTTGTQATSLMSLSNEQIIAKVGPLFTADQKKTGVLASVSMAQFLVESAYGKSELAQNANNCFGMKQNLSGNTWAGSKWDGKSIYEKITKEFTEGEYIELKRPFRKYACVEDSIEDHSVYLLGAKNGANLRYAGLKGETDYKVAAQIIKNGGYATSLTYVETLCNTIEKLGLTKFDVANTSTGATTKAAVYRVRKSWDNPSSQLGAFSSLENAKAACKSGYYVFDENGKVIYPTTETKAEFGVGSEINLVAGATYINGKSIPNWILKSKLYVREVRDNGDIVFSTVKTGAITGVVNPKYVVGYTGADAFIPYTVTITADVLNVRKGPGVLYGKVTEVKKGQVYHIVQVKNNWGLLKSNAGWISLAYTKKN